MYAMQYTIQLPTSYNMEIIRNRVRTTGHLLDGFPGLKFKAFLIREKEHGAPGNEYAPFYVWDDNDGMRAFCWGDPGYTSIVRDFGRHPIQDWTVVGVTDGPRHPEAAQHLTMVTQPLPKHVPPSEGVEEMSRAFLAETDSDTVWRVAAVDVTAWDLIHVEVSTAPAKQPDDRRADYEVLYVASGRQTRSH